MPYKDLEKQKEAQKRSYIKRAKSRKADHERKLERRKLRKLELFSDLGGCLNCGETDIACLDFHHTDPSKKDMGMNELLKQKSEKYLEELKKCIILCSNCHRKLHYYGSMV